MVDLIKSADLEARIEVDSAGTGDWHIGDPPHQGTLQILRTWGIEHPMRARQIAAADGDAFDYLIVMDDKNLRDVQTLATGRAHLARLLDYAPGVLDKNVPDPYFTGDFDAVYALVRAACENLLREVRQSHGILRQSHGI